MKTIAVVRLAAACLLAALPAVFPASAGAAKGELWEITTQIPGMPAGMTGQAQRVCMGDDPEANARQTRESQECKVTDKQHSPTYTRVAMSCPQGRMVIEQKYNAARTEFKGTMSFSGKDGDMTMTTVGRRVGTCDVQQANREREAKIAAVQKQAAEGQAQAEAARKRQAELQMKECAAAVDSMQFSRLGVYGQCHRKDGDANCKSIMDAVSQANPQVAKACNARASEFCRRFQTQEGFLKARADETAAQACGVSTAAIKAEQCPKAAKAGALEFLGAYCPAEAKPIAEVHCARRDYTSKMDGKYARFCERYLANADFARREQPARAAAPAAGGGAGETAGQAAEQVKEGINQGINKLRGLFGR